MKLVDENKRIASDHLKTADKLIKAGEFDRANEEIAKARIADPRNLYILAYEERIQYAREEAQKKAEEERLKREAAQPPAIKNAVTEPISEKKQSQKKIETPPSSPAIKTAQESDNGKKAQTEKSQPAKRPIYEEFVVRGTSADEILELIHANADRIARETVEGAQTKAQTEYKEKIDKEIHEYEAESQKRSAEQIQVAVSTFQKRLETESQVKLENEIKEMSTKAEKALEEQLLHLEDERELRFAECVKELFTIAIVQLLTQGLVDEEYTRVITGIAHGLKISPEQTIQMKKKTQERFYMDAVEVAWSDGTVSLEESERLSSLRDRFGITAEEHFQIESQVRRKMLEMKK
ncbi:MAG: hypothetical protein ABSB78_13790 [Bacteroidota bacterium]